MGSVERGGQPALTCEECGRAMLLDRAVRLDAARRQITCPECGAVTEWSIDEATVIDLRDSRAGQPHDGVEAPGSAGRRRRE